MQRTIAGYLGLAAAVLGAGWYAPRASADALSGLYVGGNFGAARSDYNTAFVDDQFQRAAAGDGDNLKIRSSTAHRDGDAWWVDAGYLPWAYVGFDAAFFHLPEVTHRSSGTLAGPAASLPLITTATVTSHGPALSLVGRVPLAESLEVNLRLGDYFGKTTLTTGYELDAAYSSSPQSATKSSLLIGVGGAYTFAGHWSLRLDYLRLNKAGDGTTVGTYSMNMATAGVEFIF
jgi:hypothetical protein